MPSPFPGMDPYLEPHWLDVHAKIVTYAADSLNSMLPQDLIASTEERVAVEGNEEDHVFAPDVRIFEPPADWRVLPEGSAERGAISMPYRLIAHVEPVIERFIKIIDAGSERLITVIEFVSPTNKRGQGLVAFRGKRYELIDSGVNFVEIDLVRAGDWHALLRPHITRQRASLYRATIRTPRDPGAVYLQPIRLQDKLPDVHIPLRQDDPKLMLELQLLLDRAYENGRYARRIDYHHAPEPSLEADDAAWADEHLRAAKRR
jgi:hypothetical protein